ncbi:MAG TPA: PBP1A family penicillin-binding protein [Terriglobia bacterium]|nr:PBP1A family penicillin-binding protein [Terriglobia bacterium]
METEAPKVGGTWMDFRQRVIGVFRGMPWWVAALLTVTLATFILAISILFHVTREINRLMATQLEGGGAGGAAVIFASPEQVYLGQEATPAMLAQRLRAALYVEGEGGSDVGTFKVGPDRLEIHPGSASYFRHAQTEEDSAELKFRNGHITEIRSLKDNSALQDYRLEPEVMTTLSGYSRSEQHLLHYADMPKDLVDAVIAVEDHDFFSHHGVNPVRLAGAALADIRGAGTLQGGSTLTMQLARNLFLTPRRTFSRKVEEIFLAELLEHRLSKQQIFELYANRIYLGQQGNFGIFGFSDAAQAYFNKDLSKLNLPEAAFLAGLIRGPNLYSPYKYHERAQERRDSVLRQMVQTGSIKQADAEWALASPLKTTKPAPVEGNQEAFFEDMVAAQLRTRFSERELRFEGLKVYTTFDSDLQRAALEGARVGLSELDREVKYRGQPKDAPPLGLNQPQISLVALDPHTGYVRALIGGRDYGTSQLNHALARRQPGSSFKPFVYAAALSSGVDGSTPVITPATLLNDQPTQFETGNDEDGPYAPRDYDREYRGMVTVHQALVSSLNVPTVSLAEMVGYDKVRNLAMAAGFNSQLGATPSIALGAYVATPMEVAGGYTIFANQGQYVSPRCIEEVDDPSGAQVWLGPVTTRRVLDPRVSFLMVNLLESVINYGTGAGVRDRGFSKPAAGKTGSSHDGWFAGFTSNLLTVAWVGYDDDRDLNLTGSQSALPVWTEFMKRAVGLPSYRDAEQFTAPPGVVMAQYQSHSISQDTGEEEVATRVEAFIQGTEPHGVRQEEPPDGMVLAQEESVPELPRTDEPPVQNAAAPQSVNQSVKPQNDGSSPFDKATSVKSSDAAKAPLADSKEANDLSDEKANEGRLFVQSDPPALEVFVDGKSAGVSPLTVRLPVGEHTYKVTPPPGKTPVESKVQIKASAVARIKVQY